MDMTVEAAALGIVRVANAAMVRALRRVTVERGIDGRQCTLLAYGGAGPMHAVEVARAFGISKVLVPAHSSEFSALGCVSAEMSYSQQRTVRMAAGEWDPRRLDAVRQSLRGRLAAPLMAAGYSDDDICLEEVAAVRYRGQSYAIEIANPSFDDLERLGRDFVDLHQKLYGFATGEPWELVSIRQRVSIPRSRSDFRAAAEAGDGSAPVKTAPCTFNAGGAVATPRYDRAGLAAGRALPGPAIVEDASSTVIVPPGATLTPDTHGHLHIETGTAP
jgi:N-methylhydantoinase A